MRSYYMSLGIIKTWGHFGEKFKWWLSELFKRNSCVRINSLLFTFCLLSNNFSGTLWISSAIFLQPPSEIHAFLPSSLKCIDLRFGTSWNTVEVYFFQCIIDLFSEGLIEKTCSLKGFGHFYLCREHFFLRVKSHRKSSSLLQSKQFFKIKNLWISSV